MNIFYVHGAGASWRSFVWLTEKLPKHTAHYFEYSVDASLLNCTIELRKQIDQISEPCLVIGHSLGGLIAAGVADDKNVIGICTLAAPLGGLPSVMFLAMFANYQLFRDLTPLNPSLRSIRHSLIESKKPYLPMVASCGLPMNGQANDGVVPVDSQTSIKGLDYHIQKVNHFEILLTDETVTLISNFMGNLTWIQSFIS